MTPEQQIIKAAMDQAVKLHNEGNLDHAEAIYKNILAKFPKTADAYNLLGTIYYQREKYKIALDLINKAISMDKKKAIYYNNLGNALRGTGETKEAEKAFRKAVKIKPKYVSALNNLGTSILAGGNLSSAISTYQKALKINPKFYAARHNLGNAYYEKGETEKALLCYREVLDQEPFYTKAARNLAETKKFKKQDCDYQRLKDLAENQTLSGEDKASVLFAFAKANDDLKNSDFAFEKYLEANKTHRQTYTYSVENDLELMTDIRSTITSEFLEQHKNSGVKGTGQIFILGMPRSGTSLVEQILASHSTVHGAGELYFMEQVVFNLVRAKGSRTVAEGLKETSSENIKLLAGNYLERRRGLATNAKNIIDKMPRNFLYVGLIKILFPDSKIIHCRRSPEDTCLSIFKKYFVGQQLFAYDLEELGQYYNYYLDHMDYWRSIMSDGFYEIDYEKLISNQQSETENLLAYCGLEWEDKCLEFHETKRVVRTASIDQVRQPIYSSSVEAWKKFEQELKPLTRVLNSR